MRHQEFEPPVELRDTIKCFWHNTRELGEPLDFDVQPDGYAEIIFYFGGLYSNFYHDGSRPLPSPFIMGLLNQPVAFHAQNRLEIIGIRCFPWTVFNLLGLPSGKDGVRLFEHPIALLQPILNELIQTGKVINALDVVTQYFLDTPSGFAANNLLFKAGGAIRGANGTMPVNQVAAAAHATVRTLERKFKQSTGHTVKDVSALIRFEQARNHLWHQPNTNLAGLAHELGYTDQPHLNREFKRYSGTTPAAFARKAKKDKPMVSSDFVAFVQA
jgi:AraC-like DNA-binding protein